MFCVFLFILFRLLDFFKRSEFFNVLWAFSMCLRIQTSPIANTLSVKVTKKGIDFKFTGSTFSPPQKNSSTTIHQADF